MRSKLKPEKMLQLYFPMIAIVAALILTSIVISVMGFNFADAIQALIVGAFGSVGAIGETLNKATPVILTGLSYAIAQRCGIINLGAEGQLYIGALAATIVGTNFEGTPPVIHITITLIAGFLGGALYGIIVGLLKNLFNASELITTIMLNYIAMSFCAWCIAFPLKDTEATSNFPQSRAVLESAQLPRLISGTRLHAGIIIAVLSIVFYFLFLKYTKKGFEMRTIGLSRTVAQNAGMRIKTTSLLAIFIAGGFAGLGGAIELLGVQFRLVNAFSLNFGFDGIAVALLGNSNALGIGLSGILFGALRSGANRMQMITKVPIAVIYMIQSFIILFVIGRSMFDFRKLRVYKHLTKKKALQGEEA